MAMHKKPKAPRPRVTELELLLIGVGAFCLLMLVRLALPSQDRNSSALPGARLTVHRKRSPVDDAAILPGENTSSPAFSILSTVGNATTSGAARPHRKNFVAHPETVSSPLVFADPFLDGAMSEVDATEIAFMRKRFVDLVGGLNQDPNDPAYFERWQQAQKQVDDEIRAYLGSEAFAEQQLQALRAAN